MLRGKATSSKLSESEWEPLLSNVIHFRECSLWSRNGARVLKSGEKYPILTPKQEF